MRTVLILSMLLFGAESAFPSHSECSELQVLIDGVPVHTYYHQGTNYIEAVKGREYSIRITNPVGVRVAVALSVDGLNTIDARHTEVRRAQKWVLEPYQSIVISGWQTSAEHARRFFFTTEERSYGAWLGQTESLGIISAAFFRERTHRVYQPVPEPPIRPLDNSQLSRDTQAPAEAKGSQAPRSEAAAPQASNADYAATGIGDRMRHDVQWIHMELEDTPFATVNLRYEFRPILVRLGVLRGPVTDDPLIRREKARGFRDSAYCPEP